MSIAPRTWYEISRNKAVEISLEPVPGTADLALVSPYSAAFVAAFKSAVPAAGRRWDAGNKRWLVGRQSADAVRALVEQHWGVKLPPVAAADPPGAELRVVRLEYLGAAKEREGSDELVALGYCDGDWTLVFPASVLQVWFLPGAAGLVPAEAVTLYGVLGVARDVGGDELKKAYRRAARTWHPDVCKEPDATQQFQRIQHAYEVLSEPDKRRKYDLGLQLTAGRKAEGRRLDTSLLAALPKGTAPSWRPPLRCGLLMVEGTAQLGRFVVSKILAWHDILDTQGRAMVSTWPPGAQSFTVTWSEF